MAAVVTTGFAQLPSRPTDPSVATQLNEAVRTAQLGNESEALSLTAKLLETHPDFVPALKFRAMLLDRARQPSQAWLTYQKALSLAPGDTDLLLTMAIRQLTAGDKDQAIDLLRRRAKLLPSDGDTLYYLAQAYHLEGDDERALKSIQACLKMEPDNASVEQKYGELLSSSGDNPTALRWLLKARQSDPTLEWIDYDIAVASFYNMDLDNAAKYASKATESQPDNSKILALNAAIQLKLARWQDARAIFEKILTRDKNDIPSLLGVGQCDLELHDYQHSVDILTHLLQLDPTQVSAHFFLAKSLNGLGRSAEAQHEMELHHAMMQQISFAPSKQDAERQKAIWNGVQKLLTEYRESEAVSLVRRSLKGPAATPGSPYVFVGAVYLSMGEPQDATRSFSHALAIDPSAHGAHTYAGILALQQGNLGAAEREFKSELTLDPNSRLARAELGEVRYRQGRWSDAVDQLTQSKTTIPRLLYQLCDAYFHLGNVPSADLSAETLAAYARNEPGMMRGLIELLNRNGQTSLAQRLAPAPGHTPAPTSSLP